MKLHIDFAQHLNPTAPWVWALLVLGLLLSATLGWKYSELQSSYALMQSRLNEQTSAKSEQSNIRKTSNQEVPPALKQEIQQANAALKELGVPWAALLNVLESRNPTDIAVTSIRPDARKGRLVIAGEARHISTVLGYVRDLTAAGIFSDVVLEQHEVVDTDPDKPVRFSLAARWAI